MNGSADNRATPGMLDAIVGFIDLVDTLRQECPWDAEQTHSSLRPHLLEEAHEVLEALDGLDEATGEGIEHVCEELGDLLFQVVFHARIAAESDRFDLGDVARGIHDKLHHRHPHVFAGGEASGKPATRPRGLGTKGGPRPGGGTPRLRVAPRRPRPCRREALSERSGLPGRRFLNDSRRTRSARTSSIIRAQRPYLARHLAVAWLEQVEAVQRRIGVPGIRPATQWVSQ